MSPTSTSEETGPRRAGWRGLPLAGFAADVAVFVLLTLAFAGLAAAVAMAFGESPADAGRTMLAIAVTASLGASLVLWLLRGRRLAALPATMPWPRAIAWGLLGGLCLQAVAWIFSQAMELAGLPLAPSNRLPVQTMMAAAPGLGAVFVVLVAPITEELAFRHVMLRRFANAGRPLAGLLLTSGLFAAAHEIGPGAQSWVAWLATTVLYAGIGLGFGGLYLRTGRLATSVAAHVAMNAVGVALLAYSGP